MATESASSSQPRLVVVATGTYTYWPPLPEAVADANQIADLLAQQEMKAGRLRTRGISPDDRQIVLLLPLLTG